jgi:hypothetical protein
VILLGNVRRLDGLDWTPVWLKGADHAREPDVATTLAVIAAPSRRRWT